MIAQFDIVPVGAGSSISQYLADVIDLVDKSGLDYRLTSMGTIVEGDWKEVIHLVKDCHDTMMKHVDRVITHITIDDRKGYTDRIAGKVKSVEQRLGREVKK
ncbi:MAG: MTH1187 family thiamine-binding protein [bacterium]